MRSELNMIISDLQYRFKGKSLFTLRVEKLYRRFNGAQGLYGLSGAGKTSFMRLLAGVIQPQKGSIHFSNRTDLTSQPRIIYAPQFPERILLGVKIGDTIRQIAAQNPMVPDFQKNIVSYLQSFALNYAEIQSKNGHELSGGELRRLALALSFAMVPDLLILDEPTIGMGGQGRQQLDLVLKSVLKQSHILVGSHDYGLIQKLCSYCWILQQGNLIFEGDWDRLESRPQVKELTGIQAYENFQARMNEEFKGL
jgi:ABC-type multidrug transport system ATPase subunit